MFAQSYLVQLFTTNSNALKPAETKLQIASQRLKRRSDAFEGRKSVDFKENAHVALHLKTY